MIIDHLCLAKCPEIQPWSLNNCLEISDKLWLNRRIVTYNCLLFLSLNSLSCVNSLLKKQKPKPFTCGKIYIKKQLDEKQLFVYLFFFQNNIFPFFFLFPKNSKVLYQWTTEWIIYLLNKWKTNFKIINIQHII